MVLEEFKVLGIKVNRVSMAQSLQFLEEAFSAPGLTRVITLNAEIAYGACRKPEQVQLINSADLVTPDGTGILWAGQQYGVEIEERVCGIDLLTALLERYRDGSRGFYFLGAKPEIIEAAVENIAKKYPDLKICGYHDGYFGKENSAAMAAEIKSSGAEILIAGMGAPFQEQWIADYGADCGVKIGIGVGGSFDVISGKVNRAPEFFIKHRLEWLYRFAKEPSRYKRIAVLPKFMAAVKKDIRKS